MFIYGNNTSKCLYVDLYMDLCTAAIHVNNIYVIHTWNQTWMKYP